MLKNRSIQIFVLCWFVYSNAYFCRTNLSISLPYMQQDMAITKTELGVIASAFFWVYACGQLINGHLGDKQNPRFFVALGLVVAGASNILFAFNRSFAFMILLWGSNGFFQSMLWGPIIRTFSAYTDPLKLKQRATYLSVSMITGSLLAYTVIAKLAVYLSWQWLYLIPGFILVLSGVVWYLSLGDFSAVEATLKQPPQMAAAAAQEPPQKQSSLLSFLVKNGLWIVAIIGMLQGVIKEGIALWGPTLISESSQADFQLVLSLFALLPIANLLAVFACARINRLLHFVEKRTMAVFFTVGIGASALLAFKFSSGLLWTIGLLALLSASIAAANTILISQIPLNFDQEGRVSTTAGFLDCAIYLGAAVSGPLFGALADRGAWQLVIILFALFSICSLGMACFVPNYKNQKKQTTV